MPANGGVLNDFLLQSHNNDGTLRDNSVSTNQLKPDALGTSQLKDNSVTASKIANAGQSGSVALVDGDGYVINASGTKLLDVQTANAEYLAQSAIDKNGLLTANSDANVASQKATKTYVDATQTTEVTRANATYVAQTIYLGPSNGTDDSAQITTALNSVGVGGIVIGKPHETYTLANKFVIPANRTLDMRTCTINGPATDNFFC